MTAQKKVILSALATELTVSTSAPVLESETSSLGNVVDGKTIRLELLIPREAPQIIRPRALPLRLGEILAPKTAKSGDPGCGQYFHLARQAVAHCLAQIVPAGEQLARCRAVADLTQALL